MKKDYTLQANLKAKMIPARHKHAGLGSVLLLLILIISGSLSNTVFSQSTVTCTPNNTNYWTGYCTSSNKYDGEIRAGEHTLMPFTYVYNGWAVFNIAAIPSSATVVNIVFSCVTSTAGGSDHILFLKKMTVDPEYATAGVIFSDIYSSGVHFAEEEIIMNSSGSHSITLNSNAIADLQSKVSAGTGWWAIGFRNKGDNDAYGAIEGHANGGPSITVTYTSSPPTIVYIQPLNVSNWTGYCTSTIKTEGYPRAGKQLLPPAVYNGWAVFDIDQIPSSADILNLEFTANTSTAGGADHILYIKKMTVDPLTAGASAIFNDIYNSGVHFADEEVMMRETGEHSICLRNTAISDLESTLTSGAFQWSLGFRNKGDNDEFGAFYGYSSTNRPEIKVTYYCPLPGNATISSNSSVCEGSSLTCTASASGATSYVWGVPSGWTILSGQNTPSAVIMAGAGSGNVTVKPVNNCGLGSTASKNITVHPLPGTATISSSSSVCEGASLSCTASSSGATSYLWGVPAGWTIVSGQNTPSVNLTAGTSSGNVTVKPSTAYCEGSTAYKYVGVYPLPTVTLTLTPCCIYWPAFALTGGMPLGGTYSGPGVSNNQFNPSNAGLGSHTITYTYTNPANGCSNSDNNNIFVDACVGIHEKNSRTKVIISPNPNQGTCALLFPSAIQGDVNLKVMNILGSVIHEEKFSGVNEGEKRNLKIFKAEKGLYTLRIDSGTFSDTVMFIIE
ncbi:MAG TPA: T9SS type A sorting domain-containing protein [Bacteroidales bacterium]|nr:T9SS type A sorting domain-containing protein [Bacteroidales bacterium]HSA44036.1 T9SS type A sorting domain-containing protein [Bacteroidales bacterium]